MASSSSTIRTRMGRPALPGRGAGRRPRRVSTAVSPPLDHLRRSVRSPTSSGSGRASHPLHPAPARPIGRRRRGCVRGDGACNDASWWRRQGSLSATAFAATLAIGANFGLVNQAEPDSPVGQPRRPPRGVRGVRARHGHRGRGDHAAPWVPTPTTDERVSDRVSADDAEHEDQAQHVEQHEAVRRARRRRCAPSVADAAAPPAPRRRMPSA